MTLYYLLSLLLLPQINSKRWWRKRHHRRSKHCSANDLIGEYTATIPAFSYPNLGIIQTGISVCNDVEPNEYMVSLDTTTNNQEFTFGMGSISFNNKLETNEMYIMQPNGRFTTISWELTCKIRHRKKEYYLKINNNPSIRITKKFDYSSLWCFRGHLSWDIYPQLMYQRNSPYKMLFESSDSGCYNNSNSYGSFNDISYALDNRLRIASYDQGIGFMVLIHPTYALVTYWNNESAGRKEFTVSNEAVETCPLVGMDCDLVGEYKTEFYLDGEQVFVSICADVKENTFLGTCHRAAPTSNDFTFAIASMEMEDAKLDTNQMYVFGSNGTFSEIQWSLSCQVGGYEMMVDNTGPYPAIKINNEASIWCMKGNLKWDSYPQLMQDVGTEYKNLFQDSSSGCYADLMQNGVFTTIRYEMDQRLRIAGYESSHSRGIAFMVLAEEDTCLMTFQSGQGDNIEDAGRRRLDVKNQASEICPLEVVDFESLPDCASEDLVGEYTTDFYIGGEQISVSVCPDVEPNTFLGTCHRKTPSSNSDFTFAIASMESQTGTLDTNEMFVLGENGTFVEIQWGLKCKINNDGNKLYRVTVANTGPYPAVKTSNEASIWCLKGNLKWNVESNYPQLMSEIGTNYQSLFPTTTSGCYGNLLQDGVFTNIGYYMDNRLRITSFESNDNKDFKGIAFMVLAEEDACLMSFQAGEGVNIDDAGRKQLLVENQANGICPLVSLA